MVMYLMFILKEKLKYRTEIRLKNQILFLFSVIIRTYIEFLFTGSLLLY